MKKIVVLFSIVFALTTATVLAFEEGDMFQDYFGVWNKIVCPNGGCGVIEIDPPTCTLEATGEIISIPYEYGTLAPTAPLYRCADNNSQWHPFVIVKEAEGWVIWDVNGAKLGPFVEGEIPEQNELIVGNGLVDLYRLETGEWQINWNHDGKTDYVIASTVEELLTNPMH